MRIGRVLAAAAAVLLCMPLAACSAASLGSNDMPGPAIAPMTGDAGGSSAAGAVGTAENISVQSARSVISSGGIAIHVEDASAAAGRVGEIAKDLGGRIEQQSVSGTVAQSATLLLRVPSARFDEAFVKLGELGQVAEQSRAAADVTMQHVDLQARVKSLETSVARLQQLMAGAATTSELIEAESALSQRQSELDGLKAQLKHLEGQIDEATIWVSLRVKSALPGGPSNFWEGLVAGFASIGAFGAGAIVVLGLLLPWIVLLGAVALAIVLPIRAARRRKRARLQQAGQELQGPAPPAPEQAPYPQPPLPPAAF